MHHWGPFFEEDGINASDGGQLALEVPLGGSVHLNCRVGMLHDKTVSQLTVMKCHDLRLVTAPGWLAELFVNKVRRDCPS